MVLYSQSTPVKKSKFHENKYLDIFFSDEAAKVLATGLSNDRPFTPSPSTTPRPPTPPRPHPPHYFRTPIPYSIIPGRILWTDLPTYSIR